MSLRLQCPSCKVIQYGLPGTWQKCSRCRQPFTTAGNQAPTSVKHTPTVSQEEHDKVCFTSLPIINRTITIDPNPDPLLTIPPLPPKNTYLGYPVILEDGLLYEPEAAKAIQSVVDHITTQPKPLNIDADTSARLKQLFRTEEPRDDEEDVLQLPPKEEVSAKGISPIFMDIRNIIASLSAKELHLLAMELTLNEISVFNETFLSQSKEELLQLKCEALSRFASGSK
jgi:hypothetical protein